MKPFRQGAIECRFGDREYAPNVPVAMDYRFVAVLDMGRVKPRRQSALLEDHCRTTPPFPAGRYHHQI